MKRKRYDRVGLTDHCEQRALLPPGGATLVSLLDAPKAFIIDLLNKEKPGGKERRENIEKMVAAGVRMHSHFAGKGTASTALCWYNEILKSLGLVEHSATPFSTASACEADDVCIQVLVNHRRRTNEGMKKNVQHVFGKLEDQLDDVGKAFLEDVEPWKPGIDDQDRAIRYLALRENFYAFNIFRDEAYCYQCKKQCKVDASSSEVQGGHDDAFICFEGGSQCVDFAAYGHRKGMLGSTAPSFYIFIAKIRTCLPDFFVHEITEVGTDGIMAAEIGDLYGIIEGVICASDNGKPMKRPRRFTYGWRLGRVKFSGSFSEFMHYFQKSMSATASCFFVMEQERQVELLRRAARNGHHTDDASSLVMENLFLPATLKNLQEHMKLQPMRQGNDGSYFIDAEQTPKFCAGGPTLPTLVRHGTIIDVNTKKILTPSEHLLAMGEPCADEVQGELPCYIKEAITDISGMQKKRIAGNAVDLGTLAPFLFYCLAHSARVCKGSSSNRA